MSKKKSEEVVATYEVRGREFDITRIAWRDSDGLSFDVTDKLTGAPLHDESFDNRPTAADVDELLANIGTALDDGDLEQIALQDWVDELSVVIAATREHTEPNGCTISIDYSDGTSARWAVGDEYGEALAVLLGTPDTIRT